MKDSVVPIDQAGRIVVPKEIRQELAIQPGDKFKISIHGTSVTLTPNKQRSGLIRKGRALVFSAAESDAVLNDTTVSGVIEEMQAEQADKAMVGLAKRQRHQ